ncbi:MAG TPA: hypothetical protein VFP34_07160, partial [Microlunatus sp.]|nr:hypothetical protein [Microlunatus sp.]
ARDRALVSIVACRKLGRQEMIDALIAAGYTATSARANQISTHPLIRRVGPDRYRVIGGSPVVTPSTGSSGWKVVATL